MIQTLMWIGAGIVTGVMLLTMVSFTLVCLFWDSARNATLVGLCGLHAALFTAVAAGLRRALARQPRPLAASLAEIAEDRKCFRTER